MLAVDRANATFLVDLDAGTAEPVGAGLATGDVRWDEGD